ncbi:nephrin-like [Danaus plexippus]|uniref:nephrin-like n=1 Tax=Danaus plexippus TaxID=13037 RepID=UPI0013C406CA|nr:nephrin-like [Danaus plexippus]
MGSVRGVVRETPGGACMLWLFILVTMTNECRGYVDTDEFVNDLDRPIPTAHVAGVLGKKGSLPCDTQPLSADDRIAMVLWFKEADWEPFYSYDVRGRSVNQPKLWSSPTGFGSRAYFRATATPAILLVDNVGTADSGVYRCRVDFKNSPTRNLRINFTVITPPNRPIIMDARTRDHTRLLEPYNEGDTLELLCEVYGGDPKPSLIWYLENTIIDESFEQKSDGKTINTLTFPSIGRQHLNSRLICQASNTNLTPPQSKLLILDINLRPLTVQILNKNRHLSADRSYEVECRTIGSRPEAQITWWKEKKPMRGKARNYSDTNTTTSVLVFTPEAEHHDSQLTCRAENTRLENSAIEDTWKLNVHYVPVITLKMGSNLNPRYIKEGDDIYFECSVQSNPKVTKLSWFKDQSLKIQQNPSSGIILSDQSLVLQRVNRNASGDYICSAQNSEGSASSNPVSLQVRYSPVCKSDEEQVFGASVLEPIELSCVVDSSPQPTSFEWIFNRDGDRSELPPSLYNVSGHKSVLRYIPTEDKDFGTLSCLATNSIGRQEIPCVYSIIAAGRPSSLKNCSIVNESVDSILVDCIEGFDGGISQVFTMEVLELPSYTMRANITSNSTPNFEVTGLNRALSYAVNLYASNPKGRSEIVTVYSVALRSPDKYTGVGSTFSLSPLIASLLTVIVLLSAATCAIIFAVYRRHFLQRHVKQPINPHYLNDSIESLPKNVLSTYSSSPKVDFNTQYELKINSEVEDDPDIIAVHYDKKTLDDYCKSKVGEGDTAKVFNDNDTSVPNTGNISFVNRGVTARVSDLRVRESCI